MPNFITVVLLLFAGVSVVWMLAAGVCATMLSSRMTQQERCPRCREGEELCGCESAPTTQPVLLPRLVALHFKDLS